jgi:hypothetical protein
MLDPSTATTNVQRGSPAPAVARGALFTDIGLEVSVCSGCHKLGHALAGVCRRCLSAGHA